MLELMLTHGRLHGWNGFFMADCAAAWGCVWAHKQGQGEIFALIPNMMYNLTVISRNHTDRKVEESEAG